MTEIVRKPADTYESAAKALFGSAHNPINIGSSSESDDEEVPVPKNKGEVKTEPQVVPDAGEATVIPEAVDEQEGLATMNQRMVLGDVVHVEGYVIIPNVIKTPKDNGWWKDMVEDLHALYNTNNNVTIFNGVGKTNDNRRSQLVFSKFDISKKYPGIEPKRQSDPAVLRRVREFTKPWFNAMNHQVSVLVYGFINTCVHEGNDDKEMTMHGVGARERKRESK